MSVLPAVVLAVVTGWLWPPPDASYQPALLACAALAPDLDRVVGAFSARLAARAYRGPGHSIPVLLAWIALLALGFHEIDPRAGIYTALSLATMGVAVHVLVDMVGPTGLALVGRRRFGLSLLAPQDVALVVLPVLALGVGAGMPATRLPAACIVWGLLLYAVGLRAMMRRRARSIAAEKLGDDLLGVYPTPWSPGRWLAVARSGDETLVLPIDAGRRSAGEAKRFPRAGPGPVTDALQATGAILGQRDDGWVLDLRYAYRWPVPPAGLRVDEEGRVARLHLP